MDIAPFKDIKITRGSYVGQSIEPNNDQMMRQVMRLRYEIFAEKLKWISFNSARLDTDEFDRHSISFGIFRNNKLLATIRATPGTNKFMLEEIFSYLLDENHKIIKEKSVELSRLALSGSITNKREKAKVVFNLYNLIYRWALKNNIRYFYLVSTKKLILSLKNRLGVEMYIFNKEATAPNCGEYGAALIDLQKTSWLSKLKFKITNFILR